MKSIRLSVASLVYLAEELIDELTDRLHQTLTVICYAKESAPQLKNLRLQFV